MIEPKIIKTEAEYRAYLAEVDRLATDDPRPGTVEGDRLELLAKLVDDYEKERFKFDRPNPVEAILFRMEQRGLRQKDLAPVLGGKNRVSEVLGGKRPLTISMVRALADHLDIPADLLIQETEHRSVEDEFDPKELPTVGFLRRSGWIEDSTRVPTAREFLKRYLAPTGGPIYLKRTITYGASSTTSKVNLNLWVGKVRELAEQQTGKLGTWRSGTIDKNFLAYVARLSWAPNGPILARQFLAEKGIALVIWPALPKTKLDGAAMRGADGAPIIGLTVRQDRVDNFWFTLLHELVHVWLHLGNEEIAITDEQIDEEREDDVIEAEANLLAREAFIPKSKWKRSSAYLRPSPENVYALADELHISAAVIAGRLRRERVGYGALTKLVGHGQVRRLFPEVKWHK